MRSVTRYAKSGDVHIAYQVVGEGPHDRVLVPGWVSHVEYAWQEPSYSRFLQRLAGFSRLILLRHSIRGPRRPHPEGGAEHLESLCGDRTVDFESRRELCLTGARLRRACPPP